MCGCGFNGRGCNWCSIIIIIVIFRYLGLLDTNCNPNSRNAITLLLLWWLCSGNCGCNMGNSNVNVPVVPYVNNNCNTGCCSQRVCCCNSCCC